MTEGQSGRWVELVEARQYAAADVYIQSIRATWRNQTPASRRQVQ